MVQLIQVFLSGLSDLDLQLRSGRLHTRRRRHGDVRHAGSGTDDGTIGMLV